MRPLERQWGRGARYHKRSRDDAWGSRLPRDTRAGSDALRLSGGWRHAGKLPGRLSNSFSRSGIGSAGRSQATIAVTRLMRLLIDECVDERLRFLFPGHDCQTARFADLAGL